MLVPDEVKQKLTPSELAFTINAGCAFSWGAVYPVALGVVLIIIESLETRTARMGTLSLKLHTLDTCMVTEGINVHSFDFNICSVPRDWRSLSLVP